MIKSSTSPLNGSWADTVIIGSIYTSNPSEEVVSAIAIKDGLYVYVGDEKGVQAYIGETTEVIKLKKEMAMPSFTDGHAHGSEGGAAWLFEVDLFSAKSIEEYISIIKEFIVNHPDVSFIKGGGWYNGYFPNALPTAEMLDTIPTDLPIALYSMDHHTYWVNSNMLKLMETTGEIPNVPGGVVERDEKGKPLGCFREKAMGLVSSKIPLYTVEEYKAGILAWQEAALGYGITAYMDPMVNYPNLIEAYQELESEGKLKIRAHGGYLVYCGKDVDAEVNKCKKLVEETAKGTFRVSALKVLLDGVVEGKTAYLLEDYADTPGFKSEPLWDQDSLNELFSIADSQGLTVHTHAIGDAAARMVVDACEYSYKKHGNKSHRHAIIHLQLIHEDDIAKMAELEMVASIQPYWHYKEEGLFYETDVPYLGEERAYNCTYPVKTLFDKGVVVSSSSDFPVTQPPQPFKAIQIGITRCAVSGEPETVKNQKEGASIKQFIASFTINGAYELFLEDVFGSIEVGKSADLIIIDKNILEINPFEIGKTTVLRTFSKGETVYRK